MLRCVVREDLSYEMATDLINDMNKCIEWLDHHFIYSGEPAFKNSSVHSQCKVEVTPCFQCCCFFSCVAAAYHSLDDAAVDWLWLFMSLWHTSPSVTPSIAKVHLSASLQLLLACVNMLSKHVVAVWEIRLLTR